MSRARRHFMPVQVQSGFSLIEVLVTMFIILVGLLGLVGLLIQAQRAQLESYQRVQALVMLNDMVSRISTNRKVASCYASTVTSTATNIPYLGTGSSTTPTCNATPTGLTSDQVTSMRARAVADLQDWNALLQANLLNARGCITVETDAVTGYLIYRVAVAWQGNGKTGAPASTACGKGLYSSEEERRAVVVPLQLPVLNPPPPSP